MKKSLDYIKGILHTFSGLNMPNSTLSYEFEILEVSKTETEIEALRQNYKLPLECKMSVKEITKEKLRDEIYNWFFKNGELSTINLDERRKNNEVDWFFENLYSTIEILKVTKIEFDKRNDIFYELGICYDYYFLHNKEQKYLLYFRYDD